MGSCGEGEGLWAGDTRLWREAQAVERAEPDTHGWPSTCRGAGLCPPGAGGSWQKGRRLDLQ